MTDGEDISEFNRLMGRRRRGKRAEVSKEVLVGMMGKIRRLRGGNTGGRPRVVGHTAEGRCRCVECRKARGEAPYNKVVAERADWSWDD
jgi:hypothetical protein